MTHQPSHGETAKPVKLTYAQKSDLKNLSNPTHHIRGRSCTNSTLNALERRGLAKLEWVESERVPGHIVARWSITPDGINAISEGA